MNVPTGIIIRNKFANNIGEGGSVKLYNHFEGETKSLMLLSQKDEVLIKDCVFEISKNEKCCIFYDGGSKGSLFKLNQCTFTGKLSPGSNYIRGRVVSNDSPLLLVKKCKFGHDLNNLKQLNTNSMHFMKMDVSEQVTLGCEKKNGLLVLSEVVAVVVLAVCLFIRFTKKNRKEDYEQSEKSEFDQEIFNSQI